MSVVGPTPTALTADTTILPWNTLRSCRKARSLCRVAVFKLPWQMQPMSNSQARVSRFSCSDGVHTDRAETCERLTDLLSRDHDELRHSLRSVLQYFRESANRFIILTSDFDFPVTYSPIKYLLGLSKRSIPENRSLKPGKRRQLQRRDAVAYYDDFQVDGDDEEHYAFARLGLLPQWLKFKLSAEDLQTNQGSEPMRYDTDRRIQGIGRWKDGNITLEVVHHAEIFDDYDGTVFNR